MEMVVIFIFLKKIVIHPFGSMNMGQGNQVQDMFPFLLTAIILLQVIMMRKFSFLLLIVVLHNGHLILIMRYSQLPFLQMVNT